MQPPINWSWLCYPEDHNRIALERADGTVIETDVFLPNRCFLGSRPVSQADFNVINETALSVVRERGISEFNDSLIREIVNITAATLFDPPVEISDSEFTSAVRALRVPKGYEFASMRLSDRVVTVIVFKTLDKRAHVVALEAFDALLCSGARVSIAANESLDVPAHALIPTTPSQRLRS